MNLPTLSIVIPTYNGRHHLARCLPSVCRFAPEGTQILVVDDCSTDDTSAWLVARFPQVELISLSSNRGFCAAANEGIRRSRGDVVELLNNDTEVLPHWAEPCLRKFKDSSVGSVAPLILQLDRQDIIDSAGMEYHICGWAWDRGFNQSLGLRYQTGCEVFGASASSGFFRRLALEQVGGLLPEYGAYFEDVDLAFRLRWAGYRCVYVPASRILHKGSSSYGKSHRVVRLIACNEELAYWINLPASHLVLGLLPHLAFVTVRTASKMLSGQLRPFLRGKVDAISQWRLIIRRRHNLRYLLSEACHSVDLRISKGNVLWRGIQWLYRRQCV